MSTRDWTNATDDEIMQADLLIELELTDLPAEDAQNLLQTFTNRVQQTVILRALAKIDPTLKPQLETLIAANDGEAISHFFSSHVPEYANIMLEETIKFKRIMLTESPAEKELLATGQAALDEARSSDLSS